MMMVQWKKSFKYLIIEFLRSYQELNEVIKRDIFSALNFKI